MGKYIESGTMKCYHLGGDYVGHPCKKIFFNFSGYVKMFTIRNWKRNLCAWFWKAPGALAMKHFICGPWGGLGHFLSGVWNG